MVTNAEDVAVSWETLQAWSDAECAAFGLLRIPEPAAPSAGQREASRELVDADGSPAWAVTYEPVPPPEPAPVPASVSNFQARAIMRQVPMPDGRSLFTTLDTALRKAVEDTRGLGEFEPARVAADIDWEAWEQANTYDRRGTLVLSLSTRFDFSSDATDDLFRRADLIRA
jgi:hypothetical protein